MFRGQFKSSIVHARQSLRAAFSNGLATEATGTSLSKANGISSSLPKVNKGTFKGLTEEEKRIERARASQVEHGRSVIAPFQHPRTHGIPVAMLHVRGHDHRALDLFLHFASHAASALAIPVSGIARLPTQRSLWTVPKGPFVHKKNQENFERMVHKRALKAWDATDAVVERWINYLQMYPQPGIGMRIVRWHRAPLGIGRKTAEKVPKERMQQLHIENITDAQRVQEVARKIVEQELGKGKVEVLAQGTEKVPQVEANKDPKVSSFLMSYFTQL